MVAVDAIPVSTPNRASVSAATTTPMTMPPTNDQARRPCAESGTRMFTLET